MAKQKAEELVSIRMETSIAGINWNARPGQVVKRPRSEAEALIESGQATPVKADAGSSEDVEAENTILRERAAELEAKVAELEAAMSKGADETAATRTGSGSSKAKG